MVSPDHEAQRANNHDGPHHHAITEDIFARMDADQVRHNAKGRQRNDVDLGVTKEPEQVLEQEWIATHVIRLVTHGHDGRHEEAGAQQDIQRHHDRANKQRREGE